MFTDPTNSLSPREYLNHLQHHYAALLGLTVVNGSVPIDPAVLKQTALALTADIGIIAPGQRPLDWLVESTGGMFPLTEDSGVLRPLLETARSLLEESERQALSDIPVGIVHLPLANAARLRVPSGGYVIVVGYGMIAGLNVAFRNLYDVLLRIFGMHFLGPAYFQEQKRLAVNFGATLRRQLWLDAEAVHDIAQLPARQSLWVWTLSWSAQLFVILHEFAHVLLRHNDPKPPHPSDEKDEHHKFIVQNHDQEFQADAFAANRLRRLARENARLFRDLHTGLPMLFYLLHMAHKLYGLESADGGTHPGSLERLDRVCEIAWGVSDRMSLPEAQDLDKVLGWLTSGLRLEV
jgi:hypothetical protein